MDPTDDGSAHATEKREEEIASSLAAFALAAFVVCGLCICELCFWRVRRAR
jgi:hypothetical protein